MDTEESMDDLSRMLLKDAIDNGNFQEVERFCRTSGLDLEQTTELVALAQIRNLCSGYDPKIKNSKLSILNSEHIKAYFSSDPTEGSSIVPIRGSKIPGSQKQAFDDLIIALAGTLDYHFQDDYFEAIDLRKSLIDFICSGTIDKPLEQYGPEIDTLFKFANLVGTSYNYILTSAAKGFLPVEEMNAYLDMIEKYISYASKAHQEFCRHSEMGCSWGNDKPKRFSNRFPYSNLYSGGKDFSHTVPDLGIQSRKDYESKKAVVDAAIDTAKKIYNSIDDVSMDVSRLLSDIPDDKAKAYIRQDIISRHQLNPEKVDEFTTPTEVYLAKRIEHPLQQFMDHGYGDDTRLSRLVEVVTTPGNRRRVAQDMVEYMNTIPHNGMGLEYNTVDGVIKNLKAMSEYGSRLYDEKIVSERLKNMVMDALKKQDIKTIKRLVPLAVLYKGNKEDFPLTKISLLKITL